MARGLAAAAGGSCNGCGRAENAMSRQPLPIDAVLPQIIAALRDGNSAVLRAPTGAGKTTRVGPAILDTGLAGAGQIVLLQPRRLAARAAAWRMAEERGSPLGDK